MGKAGTRTAQSAATPLTARTRPSTRRRTRRRASRPSGPRERSAIRPVLRDRRATAATASRERGPTASNARACSNSSSTSGATVFQKRSQSAGALACHAASSSIGSRPARSARHPTAAPGRSIRSATARTHSVSGNRLRWAATTFCPLPAAQRRHVHCRPRSVRRAAKRWARRWPSGWRADRGSPRDQPAPEKPEWCS